MNILILSAGRRTKVVEYFKNEFNRIGGKVIATDCDKLAPALYVADKYIIVPRIDCDGYVQRILQICRQENIGGIISLIDPELELIAKNKADFEGIGVKLFVSDYETARVCFDKYEMFKFLQENNIPCAKTYLSVEDFKLAKDRGEIDFPVFVKPCCGSASLGINIVNNEKHLQLLFELSDNLIIQEYLKGQEYGADCYIDTVSKELVSVFVKKKIRMRSGETDKAISFKDEKLFEFLKDFIPKLKANGTIDIDIFDVNGKWYISEVNPRFGGGYPHAYECGCNFPKYILNNMQGIVNEPDIGNYESNVIMMKHDTLTMMREENK